MLDGLLHVKDYGGTNFITGLRAVAAVMVVLCHAGAAGIASAGSIAGRLIAFGAAGVIVFFVISGFSVAASLSGSTGYRDYLLKRWWRIAPLYYAWIFVLFLLGGNHYWLATFGAHPDAYNLVMHLSFLSFLDYRITNSILGVEWTLSIEVAWYTLLPVLIWATATTSRATVSLLVAAGVTALLNWLTPAAGIPVLAFQWSPIPYAGCYILGVIAFRTRRRVTVTPVVSDLIIGAAVMVVLAVAIWRPTGDAIIDRLPVVSGATFVAILVGRNDSPVFGRILASRVSLFVGTISYGLYLCHFSVLQLADRFSLVPRHDPLSRFVLVLAAGLLVATATYYLIERPALLLRRAWSRSVAQTA